MLRALEVGVYCFNVESKPGWTFKRSHNAKTENWRIFSLRVNPMSMPKRTLYFYRIKDTINFGIDIKQADACLYKAAQLSGIKIKGVDCHIGSQLAGVAHSSTPWIAC